MKFLSALVTQGSGVMGNLVIERNGVIRTRNSPANPSTLLQQAARATLGSYAQSWSRDLSASQRAGWNTYAGTVLRTDALGKSVKLSGIDCYVSANAALTVAGQAAVNDRPPNDGGLALPAVLSVVIDDSANTAVFTFASSIAADVAVNLSLSTGSISLGRSKFSGPYRFKQSQMGLGTGTVTFTGVTVPATGEQWAWRLLAVNVDGQVSKPQDGLTVVVA